MFFFVVYALLFLVFLLLGCRYRADPNNRDDELALTRARAFSHSLSLSLSYFMTRSCYYDATDDGGVQTSAKAARGGELVLFLPRRFRVQSAEEIRAVFYARDFARERARGGGVREKET